MKGSFARVTIKYETFGHVPQSKFHHFIYDILLDFSWSSKYYLICKMIQSFTNWPGPLYFVMQSTLFTYSVLLFTK